MTPQSDHADPGRAEPPQAEGRAKRPSREAYAEKVRVSVEPLLSGVGDEGEYQSAMAVALAWLEYERAKPAAKTLPDPRDVGLRAQRLCFLAPEPGQAWRDLATEIWDGSYDADALATAVQPELAARLPAETPASLRIPLANAARHYFRTYAHLVRALPTRGVEPQERALFLRKWACVKAWQAFLGSELLSREALGRQALPEDQRASVLSYAGELVIFAELIDLRTGIGELALAARALTPPAGPNRAAVGLRDPSEGRKRGASGKQKRLADETRIRTNEEQAESLLEEEEARDDQDRALEELRGVIASARRTVLVAVAQARLDLYKIQDRYGRLLDCVDADQAQTRQNMLDIGEDPDAARPTLSRARTLRRRLLAKYGIVSATPLPGFGERLGARHVVTLPVAELLGPRSELDRLCDLEEAFEAASLESSRDASSWDSVDELLAELHEARGALRSAAHAQGLQCVHERGLVLRPKGIPDELWRGEQQGREGAHRGPQPCSHAAEAGRVIVCPPAPEYLPIEPEPTLAELAEMDPQKLEVLEKMLGERGVIGEWMYFTDGGVGLSPSQEDGNA